MTAGEGARSSGRWKPRLQRLRLLAVALLGLGGCAEQAAPPAPAPPPEVTVAEVLQHDVPIYVEWVGSTDGNVNAQARARVRG